MATSQNYTSNISHLSEKAPSTGVTTSVNVGKAERIISALGGAAISAIGLSRKTPLGIGLAVAGGYLIYRGASGNCPINSVIGRNSAASNEGETVEIVEYITVNKPRHEVYNFWRKLSNLPLFMKHIEEVTELDEYKSSWRAQIPGNVGTISWEAEIIEQEQNVLLAWRSLPGATVDNAGRVEFKDAPGDQGTEVRAIISYRAPAGAIGKQLASLLNPVFGKIIKEDIRGFKQYLETGELPTNSGQPTGKRKRKDDLRNLPILQ